MDDHPDADDIVKVEMQDVYPSSRQQPEMTIHDDQSPISSTSRHLMDSSRGSHYEHVTSINDQSSISVEQRAAAIMDRIKQLYYIDEDPARKDFLDDYFEFMRKRDATVTRIPTMAKQPLDLYKLYKTVVSLGGLTEVVRNRHWSKVTRELNLPASITSAAFTLRTQYLRFLYAYECFQKGIDEQSWKLEDCDDLSNGSFRATQASPASFVDTRSCGPSRDLPSDQHHSPQWHNEQLICGPMGPRPPFGHVQQHLSLQHGPPHAGFSHPIEIHCSELVHRGSKLGHLSNGHIIEARNPIEQNNNECPPNCDCNKNINGTQSPSIVSRSTPTGRGSNENEASPVSSGSATRDFVISKGSEKSDGSEESKSHEARPSEKLVSQPVTTDRHSGVFSTAVGPHSVPLATNSSAEMHSECPTLQGEQAKQFCQNNKDEHHPPHPMHEHSLHEHLSRMHFPMGGHVLPGNMLQYSRNPYCNPRKRPRFYGPNEGPMRGGCGCGRGEILESSEPMTFKVHYRTEQRVFVTLQFGKKMYLGELFAEELE